MMKGLLYSQFAIVSEPSLLPFLLSKRLCREMDIDLLYGSPAKPPLLVDPHFRLLTMPAFNIDLAPSLEKAVTDPIYLQKINEQFDARTKFYEKELKPPYNFLITENFPFGKIFLRKEILFIRDLLKRAKPNCRIICALPDGVEITTQSMREKALQTFLEFYDAVVVHADPKLIRLEDSFPQADKFREKIIYSGFLPNRLEPASQDTVRKKKILIPISWQFFGEQFVRAVLPVMASFSAYEFVFVLPRNAPPFLEEILQAWKKNEAGSKIQILPPQKSLEKLMRESSLCITLANSYLIDMLDTHTPGLAFAAGSKMQMIRLEKFAAAGLIRRITPNDLVPRRMKRLISFALAAPYPKQSYNTNGADSTLLQLKKMIS